MENMKSCMILNFFQKLILPLLIPLVMHKVFEDMSFSCYCCIVFVGSTSVESTWTGPV